MKRLLLITLLVTSAAVAAPILQMNKAFNTLSELMPYLTNDAQFKEKKNEALIKKHLEDFESEFKLAGHDQLLKNDLFAPSYQLMIEGIKQSKDAFNQNKKEYALWMIRDSLGSCLECHTRLPQEHASSFQNGELQIDPTKFSDRYDLGVAYLIVRRFVDAKEQFVRVIQDKLIKNDQLDYLRSFQQVLLIELKVMKDPAAMESFIQSFENKKIPEVDMRELLAWKGRLEILKKEKFLKSGIKNEKELAEFIKRRLVPIEDELFEDKYKPDLLLASGMLSVYFFQNPESKSAANLNYWLGKIESELRKDQFLSSADLFLKQCIKKYPLNPIAKKCFSTLKEYNEFMFSGTGGTDIPDDVQKEMTELKKLIEGKK